MIFTEPARLTEPKGFDLKCRQKGRQWLIDHPKATRKKNSRPKDFWTPFKPSLADAFTNLCAYSAMYEPVGTVDHFVPVDTDENLAYEWRNYRFASAWINSSKQKTISVLDPLVVRDGWFEILLPSLQLKATDMIPAQYRLLAEETLKRLHLVDDQRVIRQRSRWYQQYNDGKLTLDGLRESAPLIAAAVEKASS